MPIAVEMTKKKMLIPGTLTYDASSNKKARDLYWKMLAGSLFSVGVDAFWLDASEPEALDNNPAIEMDSKVFLGREAVYANSYPYLHTLGVYENWRKTSDAKRVFLVTRSAFAGSQHNAAASWSGDVYSTFWGLERQLPAELNFALSGLPYWTTDIGGYGYPSYKSGDDPVFQELYTRWFEYGVFCPLFRTHGHRANSRNELSSYGDKEPILVAYDRLRYRMLPYVYSLAAKVTCEDYTIMRPLGMDWRQDEQVREIGDQFMFGPALMVAPVTRQGRPAGPFICPRPQAGGTSGLAMRCRQASGLPWRRSTGFRSTCGPDRFCPWGRTSSMPDSPRKSPSRFASILAPMAISRSMTMLATVTATSRVSRRRFRCIGTTGPES